MPAPRPASESIVDPLPWRQRFLLTLIATAAVSIGAGVFNPNVREPVLGILFVFLFATGAGFGVRWATRNWLAAMKNEPRLLRHLAMGGPAALFGVLMSVGVVAAEEHAFRNIGETIAAICLSLLIVDWTWRTDPHRDDRMALGDVMFAAVPGLVTATMFGGDVVLAVGVLAASCMAAQVGSAWRGDGKSSVTKKSDIKSGTRAPVPPTAALPPEPPEPLPPVGFSPPASGASHPGIGSMVSQYGREGVSIVRRFMRFVASVIGFVLLLAALFGSLTLAYDLPGVMAVGGFGSDAPREMTHAFGTSGWPSILRAMIASGVFLLALLAATVFLMLRRAKGGLHMLRAAAGIFLILWAPFVLFTGVKAITVEGPFSTNGWVITELYLGQIQASYALRAAVVLFAGVMLLIWPARGRGAAKPVAAAPAVAA
jgi:hypothetical protein